MKTNQWVKACLFLAASLVSSAYSHAQFKVVGYVTSWSGSVSSVQYSKLTHINYAFAEPNANGTLQAMASADLSKLQSLVSTAHANGVKVLISIGGWNNGDDSGFETLAGNSTSRSTFASSVLSFVNQYGLDGADIDWEYPDAGTSANNFSALMSTLSSTLHGQGKLLTAAVVGNPEAGVNTDVFGYVDYLNIMAYDANNFDHSTYAYATQSINYWKGRGLPAAKTVLGVPFYARPSQETYAQLLAEGASPYADTFNGNGYNGITTIKSKTDLAYSQGGGIMMWELAQDATGTYSLLSAIHDEYVALSGNNNGGTFSTQIEAENYSNMSGVQTEATTDAGGGLDVGYIDTGDWMAYANVTIPTTGTYKVEYRVACATTAGQLSIDLNAGSVVLGYLNVPVTGGWQNWTTISHNVSINAGTYAVGIYAQTGGWNLNWFRITKVNTAKATLAVAGEDHQEVMKHSLEIYPNPVASTLLIKGDFNQPGGLITVYDLNGKQVMNAKGGTTSLDVAQLPTGTYVFIYTKGDQKVSQKFVKQ
jgi:chitinase